MTLSSIIVYPIKSLDGASLSEVRISSGGALCHDRTWAMMDSEGRTVNAKRFPQVQCLRTTYSSNFQEVEIGVQGESFRETFSLVHSEELAAWLSAFLGFQVNLVKDDHLGFPDDRKAWGPTLISEGTLKTVAEWFPDLEIDNVRRRFRANLELDTSEPFWEDRLFAGKEELFAFSIGQVSFSGHNPCARCPVPARDPDKGTPDPTFQAEFSLKRKQTLPDWVNGTRFDHFYRLAVNTSIEPSQGGLLLQVGDHLQIKQEAA